MEEAMHQIGEVAEAVGLSVRTIRYYEEVEIVPPSGRSIGGFRLYTEQDIDRLRLIKKMKPLDLTIDEMRDLLVTRDRLADPTTRKRDRDALAQRLITFAELIEQHCCRLRGYLDAGEQLIDVLRSEADTAHRLQRPRT